MEYPLLAALLAVESIKVKAGFFGGKPFAAFTAEDLEKVEQALQEKNATPDEKMEEIKQQLITEQELNSSVSEAVDTAMELNGLDKADTVSASVELLGAKCKEFGEKSNKHTNLSNDGKENEEDGDLIDGYLDPEAEHNKILTGN